MNNELEFLREPHIIQLLLMLSHEDELTKTQVCEELKIAPSTLKKSLSKLRVQNLMNKSTIKLTPRGKYIATLLGNINFYLGGRQSNEKKNKRGIEI